MKKLHKQAGFTLAELLIVVAIIAILVAIGIPAFSTAMERSRETVDLSNLRGAYAEFMAQTLGGTEDTGYFLIDIKQRNFTPTNNVWIVDTSGFTTNLSTPTASGAGTTTPPVMPQPTATGATVFKFQFPANSEKPICVVETTTPTGLTSDKPLYTKGDAPADDNG